MLQAVSEHAFNLVVRVHLLLLLLLLLLLPLVPLLPSLSLPGQKEVAGSRKSSK